jgi:hypothetical protein
MTENQNNNTIEIPTLLNEVIVVPLDELPPDASELLSILEEEETSREFYLRFAVRQITNQRRRSRIDQIEYLKRQQENAFMEVLEKGLESMLFIHIVHCR